MIPIPKKTDYFKSFDGTKIYYEIHGVGQPIVLAYGIGCLINHWQKQIKYLSQKYQHIQFLYKHIDDLRHCLALQILRSTH